MKTIKFPQLDIENTKELRWGFKPENGIRHDHQLGIESKHASGRSLVSCWQPSLDEIARINNGEPIWVLGEALILQMDNPFEEKNIPKFDIDENGIAGPTYY